MTIAMRPIYTQTASGSVSAITFNNIPQTFSDLMIEISARAGVAATNENMYFRCNADTTAVYSQTRLYGSGSGAASDRASAAGYGLIGNFPGSTATSNTYGNSCVYIPNYTSSNFKQLIGDSVAEDNFVTAYQIIGSALWRQTNPITSFTLGTLGGSAFTNFSTFTLYGITKG